MRRELLYRMLNLHSNHISALARPIVSMRKTMSNLNHRYSPLLSLLPPPSKLARGEASPYKTVECKHLLESKGKA